MLSHIQQLPSLACRLSADSVSSCALCFTHTKTQPESCPQGLELWTNTSRAVDNPEALFYLGVCSICCFRNHLCVSPGLPWSRQQQRAPQSPRSFSFAPATRLKWGNRGDSVLLISQNVFSGELKGKAMKVTRATVPLQR